MAQTVVFSSLPPAIAHGLVPLPFSRLVPRLAGLGSRGGGSSEPAPALLLRAPGGGPGSPAPRCCPAGPTPVPMGCCGLLLGPLWPSPRLAPLLQAGLCPGRAAPEPGRLYPQQAPAWAPCCFLSASTSCRSRVASVLPDSGCWRERLTAPCGWPGTVGALPGPEGSGLPAPTLHSPGRESSPAWLARAPHLQGCLHLSQSLGQARWAAPSLALPPAGSHGPPLLPHSVRGALREAPARGA